MAAFTSKATGNWSSGGQTTWNEVGVPGAGDTVTIGAHTVTVDVNTIIGTSPNDATTKAITQSNAASLLVVGLGVTLTVRGNFGMVHDSGLTLRAGSSFIFDNALSGGSPIYTITNGGFSDYVFEGTTGAHCTFGAIVGQTCSISGAAWQAVTATFTDFVRVSGLTMTVIGGDVNLTNCTFTGCGQLVLPSASNSLSVILRNLRFSGGSHASFDLTLSYQTAAISGTREMSGCVFEKAITYFSKSVSVFHNYFGNGIESVSANSSFALFRGNFVKQDGQRNSGNGQIFGSDTQRNYFVVESATGNPHFIEAQARLGVDVTFEQNVFESQSPDLFDVGDVFLFLNTGVDSGRKVVSRNNIVLRAPAGVTSGSLLTLYDANANTRTEWYRNTANVNGTTLPIQPPAMLSLAEANTGTAGQVQALKSNLAWASTAVLAGFIARRLSGNVKDIITAGNADRNWRHNIAVGDNQRGYEDIPATNTLWTAGDAVAAGVDVNGSEGDPQFFDNTRNIAKWNGARGYGAATYAAALTTLQADPTKTVDLIDYVFEGFRVQNAACRNAAHDGAAVGAANFIKPTRVYGYVEYLGAYLQEKYDITGISVGGGPTPTTVTFSADVTRGIAATVAIRS